MLHAQNTDAGCDNTPLLDSYPDLYNSSLLKCKITMIANKKYIGIVAVAMAITIAPLLAQSAFAADANTKVRAFQNGVLIDDVSSGQILTTTDCVGGIDTDEGATKMKCYLIPPGVSNNDNSNAIASFETSTNVACPADAGFGAAQECFSIPFDGSLFDQQGDWHFHAEFYNAEDELIADGRQTFANNSFFVLPESPIGVAALVVSSLAVLGGFMLLRSRSHSNLPI